MDALIAQIAQLRISAENITHMIEEVAAAAAAVAAVAAPVGAGLPPTEGAQGPVIATYLLPPPCIGEPQLTLGVAVAATFGNPEGKDLYPPSLVDLDASKAWAAADAGGGAAAGAGGCPSEEDDDCACSMCEEVFWGEREAAAAARYAEPTEPVPAGFSPALQGGKAIMERLDPEARRMKADMDYYKEELRGGMRGCTYSEVERVAKLAARLQQHWDGRWTTMPSEPPMDSQPSGQRVLIYHFHAFEPPADGSYKSAQPLKHLGLYNPFTRLIEPSACTPTLPAQDAWPF
jgi:hypothetical protein